MDSPAVKIIRPILVFLSRLTIARYRPRVVGVTGSVGKTSTKRAVATVIAKVRRVRMAEGNLNNEIGVSLAILGDWSMEELRLVSRDQPAGTASLRKLIFWSRVILIGAYRVVVKSKKYPEVLVLEYGADRPGDILRLMRIAQPEISIVTTIGEVPVHVEFYAGPKDVAREKARLIERLSPNGFAVLNHDDSMVDSLRDHTRGHVMTYGFERGVDLQITRLENRVADGIPAGISFKFEYEGSSVPVRMDGIFGKAFGICRGRGGLCWLDFRHEPRYHFGSARGLCSSTIAHGASTWHKANAHYRRRLQRQSAFHVRSTRHS